MKYLLAIVVLGLLAAGCEKTPLLTNDQIIEETKKCESAGLAANVKYDVSLSLVIKGISTVYCVPK